MEVPPLLLEKLKRKRTPREDEPGNSTGESGNPGSITRWLREDEPSINPVDGPMLKKDG